MGIVIEVDKDSQDRRRYKEDVHLVRDLAVEAYCINQVGQASRYHGVYSQLGQRG